MNSGISKQVRAYGSWPSPLDPAAVAGGARRLGDVRCCEDWIYWSEGRPAEKGRQVLMRARVDAAGRLVEPAIDILSEPFSARSRIHEYGGGDFMVAGDCVYFSNDTDQDLYELVPGNVPQRLTNEPSMRFASRFGRDADA